MKKVMLSGLVMIMGATLAYAEGDPSIFTRVESGRKTVTTAGTAEALSSTSRASKRIQVCAEDSNTGVVAVGGSGVIAAEATRTGVYLYSGDCAVVPLNDPSNVFVNSVVTGDGVVYNLYN